MARNELHGVINRHAIVHGPAGRIDVHVYVAFGVISREVEQLCDDRVGYAGGDRRAQKNYPLFQQERIDVVSALSSRAGLNDHRNQVLRRFDLGHLIGVSVFKSYSG